MEQQKVVVFLRERKQGQVNIKRALLSLCVLEIAAFARRLTCTFTGRKVVVVWTDKQASAARA
jgi:hypothetical protein